MKLLRELFATGAKHLNPHFQQARAYCAVVTSRIDLSDPKQQRAIAIILGVSMGCLLIGSVTWATVVELKAAKEEPVVYNPLRFDQYDAELICSEEMSERLGSNLLRYYVDDHSSRFDSHKGLYRLYFKADVGKREAFDEVTVYCFVSSYNYELTHYKEYNQSKKPIVSTDLKFFGG